MATRREAAGTNDRRRTPTTASPVHHVISARGQTPDSAWVNESLLQSLANHALCPVTTTTPIQVGGQIFPPGTYSVPQPTEGRDPPRDLLGRVRRPLLGGPPRFSNQAATIHIYSNGKSVTSNQFLKGRAQVLLFPPADPTATPTTEDPVAGQVAGW